MVGYFMIDITVAQLDGEAVLPIARANLLVAQRTSLNNWFISDIS